MNFASDNTAGSRPPFSTPSPGQRAMPAATATTIGRKPSSGGLRNFEREVAVFLVPTGTAANALALAQVSPPWGVVFCHAESHIATDECGAPEFFGDGLKLVGLPGDGAKIAPDTLQTALAGYGGHSPHQMVAGGAVDHPGQRSRHHLPHRRDRGACRDRACTRARRAHGRRAFRQCTGAAQRQRRRK